VAYSRWMGREGWYVYRETGHDEPTLRMMLGLTDPTIEQNVRSYSATFKQLDGISHDDLWQLVPEASANERQELMEYVEEFCEHVREEQHRMCVVKEYDGLR